jgi:PKD domain
VIPLVSVASGAPAISPKNCQDDAYYASNGRPQEPNGSPADLILSPLTHEDAESITDPLLNAWFDGTPDHEAADACINYGYSADPLGFQSPFAFAPTLGGSEAAGTLYDQLDNGHRYYIQSMWSNGNVGCVHRPSRGTITARFAVPSKHDVVGSRASFDPAASSSTAGYSSVAWSFGDGATSFKSTATESKPAPIEVSHAYKVPGTYTVTLTLVDTLGNLSRATRTISVGK